MKSVAIAVAVACCTLTANSRAMAEGEKNLITRAGGNNCAAALPSPGTSGFFDLALDAPDTPPYVIPQRKQFVLTDLIVSIEVMNPTRGYARVTVGSHDAHNVKAVLPFDILLNGGGGGFARLSFKTGVVFRSSDGQVCIDAVVPPPPHAPDTEDPKIVSFTAVATGTEEDEPGRALGSRHGKRTLRLRQE